MTVYVVSLEDFFGKERISAEAQKNLKDMGLESVEDLVVITNEMYRRAGVSEIGALKLVRKVAACSVPF